MSASPESVRKAFDESRPIVNSVSKYVGNTLRQYCDRNKFLFADRVKGLGSLSEKLESGRFASWSELDDLYACTIVVPTTAAESGVLEFLGSAFREERRRGRADAQKAPDSFRFDGMRWYGRVFSGATDRMPRGTAELVFEVQVLTAFEHAWSSVTHALVYKSDEVSWRRRRLAAQLKAAVEQIDLIIAAFDQTSAVVPESPWPEFQLKQAIASQFRRWMDEGKIPDAIVPDSWSRFADNVYELLKKIGSDANRRELALSDLFAAIEAEFEAVPPVQIPVSGTLLQYVLGVLSRMGLISRLKKYHIVPSIELRELHGVVGDPPMLFKFDTIPSNIEVEYVGEDTALETPE